MTETEAPELWQVRSRDGKRVHFEGTEDDAYTYVENNFPHVHAEPNTHYPDGIEPDVYVHEPDGETRHGFVGGEWDADENDENDDNESEDES